MFEHNFAPYLDVVMMVLGVEVGVGLGLLHQERVGGANRGGARTQALVLAPGLPRLSEGS